MLNRVAEVHAANDCADFGSVQPAESIRRYVTAVDATSSNDASAASRSTPTNDVRRLHTAANGRLLATVTNAYGSARHAVSSTNARSTHGHALTVCRLNATNAVDAHAATYATSLNAANSNVTVVCRHARSSNNVVVIPNQSRPVPVVYDAVIAADDVGPAVTNGLDASHASRWLNAIAAANSNANTATAANAVRVVVTAIAVTCAAITSSNSSTSPVTVN